MELKQTILIISFQEFFSDKTKNPGEQELNSETRVIKLSSYMNWEQTPPYLATWECAAFEYGFFTHHVFRVLQKIYRIWDIFFS